MFNPPRLTLLQRKKQKVQQLTFLIIEHAYREFPCRYRHQKAQLRQNNTAFHQISVSYFKWDFIQSYDTSQLYWGCVLPESNLHSPPRSHKPGCAVQSTINAFIYQEIDLFQATCPNITLIIKWNDTVTKTSKGVVACPPPATDLLSPSFPTSAPLVPPQWWITGQQMFQEVTHG